MTLGLFSASQVAPGGRGQDVGVPLAGARPVAQVSAAHPQVPALRIPLVAARQRHHPREVRTHRRFNKNHHEHFLNMDGWIDDTCRDCGLALNMSSLPMDTMDGGADDGDACAVCLERPCNVAAEGLSVGEILLNSEHPH